MRKKIILEHKFLEYIPKELQEDTVYVSITFDTVVHKCCCGCGNKVVTPLSPRDWNITYDGESISLYPSIGNWSFPCQSHYWIKRGQVEWAGQWSKEEIEAGRRNDRLQKKEYYDKSIPEKQSDFIKDHTFLQKLWLKVKSFFSFYRVSSK